jgi:hypothetical protein
MNQTFAGIRGRAPGARSLFGHNEHSEGRKRKDSIANGFSDSGSVTVE